MLNNLSKQKLISRNSIGNALWWLLFACLVMPCSTARAQDDERQQPTAELVQIPLPLTTQKGLVVQQIISNILEKTADKVRREERPFIVLEFDTSNGRTGRGSDLEACQKLARFLIDPQMNKVRTVAYIPTPRGYIDNGNAGLDATPTTQINGYAVLVALVADEIAMHPDTAIGNADFDNPGDEFAIGVFSIISDMRTKLPPVIAMSMIDRRIELSRIESETDIVYADQEKFAEVSAAGDAPMSKTLSPAGETLLISSKELLEFRLIEYEATSRNDLARQLNVPENSLDGDPTLGKEWDAVQIDLPGYVDDQTVQWVARALDARSPSLIMFRIDSSGGDASACLRMASRIAGLNPSEVRTIAYVEGEARGPAAVIAMMCDNLVLKPNAVIGGPADPPVDEETILNTLPTLKELAIEKGLDWSQLAVAMNPELPVARYKHIELTQVRILSEEEHQSLEDSDRWQRHGPIGLDEGLDADSAATHLDGAKIIEDMERLKALYQLESEPESLAPTAADRWLENIASFLASPFIAPFLLFGAVFFISTEMSAPGVGVPGFLGTLCLVLFFWSQFLEGNAQVLEILMFVVGVIFLLMEIFLLPGIGIFGIGGLILVVVSIVLASQTFIFPRTAAEISRLPVSLSMVLAAGMGFVAAAVVLRKVIPNTPYLKKIMLEPPKKSEDTGLGGADPEALVDLSHLEGRKGETISRLNPGGKARINGEIVDVISPGLMVDKGAAIEVTKAVGNRVEVKPVAKS